MWDVLPTIASPWALLPGAVAIGILWKLFRRAPRKLRQVDFLWHGLFFDNPPRATSSPPPWLWCLLLAVLCFTLAASQPVLRRPDDRPEHGVVLLDTGVASQSREQSGRPRLELLIDALVGMLEKQSARDRFLLVTAGLEPVESDDWLTATELIRKLKQIKASDGPTDWPAAFDRAEVHLARTDGRLIVAAGTPNAHYQAWLKATKLDERPHLFVRAGQSAANAGIESIAVFHSPFAESTRTLEIHARLRAFSRDQQRRIEVRLNGEPVAWTIDGRPTRELPVNIAHQQAMTFPLAGLPEPGRMEIRLLPSDDQPADDVARAIIPEVKPLRVGFLSQDPLVPQFLEHLPGVQAMPLTAPDQAATVDLCIVDRRSFGGEALPDTNCLVFAGSGTAASATLMGVHDQHPLCKGLGAPDFRAFDEAWLGDVRGADIAMVGAASDAAALPSGLPQPVVWTHVRNGRRVAGFAFSPFDFDYQQFRKMPLLLVNTIEWLSPSASEPLAVQLGAQPDFLKDPRTKFWEATEVIEPASASPAEPTPPLTTLDRAGFYRAAPEGHAPWQFAANAPAVPIVGEKGSRVTSWTKGATVPAGQTERPLDFWFWIAGAALLALEVLLFLHSVVHWSNPLASMAERRLLREAAHNAAQRERGRAKDRRP